MKTSPQDDILDRISDFLDEVNNLWSRAGYKGEMWCEIRWYNGKWTVEIGDGSCSGKSDAYCCMEADQLKQAVKNYLPELLDWIEKRPKYGHSVAIEKRVLKIVQRMVKEPVPSFEA